MVTFINTVVNSFIWELQDHYPDHVLSTVPDYYHCIIEGQKEVLVGDGFNWASDLRLYHIYFAEDGIRIASEQLDLRTSPVFVYDDPRLFEIICKAIDEAVQP
jgi:hypothetical protein